MTSSVLVALRVQATPERTFDVFTGEIAIWWRPDPLFQITPSGDGVLAFEGGAGGRLVALQADGKLFEIGKVTRWERGRRLAFTWRHATFAPEQATRVDVSFDAVGEETRVSVTHYGWTSIPRGHVARHGFPDDATQQRAAEWWRRSLDELRSRLN